MKQEYSNSLERLSEAVLDPKLAQEMPPLFFDYFGSVVTTREGIKGYFNDTATLLGMLRLSELEKKDVLDIGCGFGLRTICMSLLGCRSALGVDISSEMTSGFRTLLRKFPELNIEIRNEDFLLGDYQSDSFDVAILYEAISHIRDTDFLLDKVKEVLRPSGVLYISDGNNDLCLIKRFGLRKRWERSECGPIDESMADHGREVDRLPFLQARMEIIRKAYPLLDSNTVQTIAQETQGMWGEQITNAARSFLETGRIEEQASFPYRNPYTGEFSEFGFNPFTLARKLERKGFRCQLVPPRWAYIRNSFVERWEIMVAKVLSPVLRSAPGFLLPFLSPSFHIVAIKSEEARYDR